MLCVPFWQDAHAGLLIRPDEVQDALDISTTILIVYQPIATRPVKQYQTLFINYSQGNKRIGRPNKTKLLNSINKNLFFDFELLSLDRNV